MGCAASFSQSQWEKGGFWIVCSKDVCISKAYLVIFGIPHSALFAVMPLCSDFSRSAVNIGVVLLGFYVDSGRVPARCLLLLSQRTDGYRCSFLLPIQFFFLFLFQLSRKPQTHDFLLNTDGTDSQKDCAAFASAKPAQMRQKETM